MDIHTLTSFFGWCTVINGGVFALGTVFLRFAPEFVYRIQSAWFPIPRTTYDVVVYSFLALFKIFFLIFNFAPYVALRIIG